MTMKWNELVEAHRNPSADRDPQRATLRAKAIAQVEEGLRHLASVGFAFEIVVKGSVPLEAPPPGSLDLDSAIGQASTKH